MVLPDFPPRQCRALSLWLHDASAAAHIFCKRRRNKFIYFVPTWEKVVHFWEGDALLQLWVISQLLWVLLSPNWSKPHPGNTEQSSPASRTPCTSGTGQGKARGEGGPSVELKLLPDQNDNRAQQIPHRRVDQALQEGRTAAHWMSSITSSSPNTKEHSPPPASPSPRTSCYPKGGYGWHCHWKSSVWGFITDHTAAYMAAQPCRPRKVMHWYIYGWFSYSKACHFFTG